MAKPVKKNPKKTVGKTNKKPVEKPPKQTANEAMSETSIMPLDKPEISSKKSITTEGLLDKLEVMKIAFQSTQNTLETICQESPSQKRSIEIIEAAFNQIEEISESIREHGFTPNLDDLHRIVNRAILTNRLIVRDPNRIRSGAPVLYSSIHPEFPLDMTTLDHGKDAVIVNVRKSRGSDSSSTNSETKKLKRGQTLGKGVIPADSEI